MKSILNLLFAGILLTIASCTQPPAQQTQPTADNAAISKKAHMLFSENKFDDVVALTADNIQVVSYAAGQTFSGKEEFRNFMTGFKTAFPDLVIKHTNVFEDGKGNVALEFEATGTHTGPLVGPGGTIPPTGKTVNLSVSETHRVENGKIVAIHNYQDSGSLMMQLGVLPPPAAPTTPK